MPDSPIAERFKWDTGAWPPGAVHTVLHHEDGQWWCESDQAPGCTAAGDTREECIERWCALLRSDDAQVLTASPFVIYWREVRASA